MTLVTKTKNHNSAKLVTSIVLVIALIAIFLVFQASKTGIALVLLPSDLLKNSEKDLNFIRVAGRVADQNISYKSSEPFELSFSIEDPKDSSKKQKSYSKRNKEQFDKMPHKTGIGEKFVPVIYKGLKPDMFAVGRDVIIDGNYEQGVLLAKNLLTQCPSKYEPPNPAKLYKDKQ